MVTPNKKPGLPAGFSFSERGKVLLLEEAEFLVEARDAAAAVDEALLAASPCGVGLWIDVEAEAVAGFAIGRAGHEFRAVGHDNGDRVIVWVNAGFHGLYSRNVFKRRWRGRNHTTGEIEVGGSIEDDFRHGKPPSENCGKGPKQGASTPFGSQKARRPVERHWSFGVHPSSLFGTVSGTVPAHSRCQSAGQGCPQR
jgi:hypothetical protein